MHSGSSISVALILALSIAITSCSKSVEYKPLPPDPYEDLKAQIAQSPRPDEEAELMVLFSTEHVVAHQRDYDRVREAASLVRETFRDSIPFLDSVKFVYRYQESVFGLVLSDAIVEELREGDYVDWDSLNMLYRVSEIDTSRLASSRQVELSFEGRLNPRVLSGYYHGLFKPVDSVQTYLYLRFDDYSNIYPWMSGFDDHTFLLRKAWGDCLNQCDYNRFWYFKVVDGEAKYIGEYSPDDSPVRPNWWNEARTPFCTYISYTHTLCDGL